MTSFENAFAFVLASEGSWSADPNDRGNWTSGMIMVGEMRGTKYGISAASYPTLDIKNLTLGAVEAIYRTDYWARINGDDLPPRVALVVFDCAVHQGVGAAKALLQQTVGVIVDGIIGPRTRAAVEAFDQRDLVIELCAQRALSYADLDGFSRFGLGWMRRLFRLQATALA